MTRTPWPVFAAAFVVTAVGFLVRLGMGGSQVIVAMVAAAALCVGCALAPVSYGTTALAPAGVTRRRVIQFSAAVLAALVASWVFVQNAGTAAIYGIVVAIVVGALAPRENAVRDR